ncbi:MAG: hypothetical protein HDT19_05860, partial [Oscillibacter sp.]|nr:hypothetical protein [Oscillibacter sp.]
NPVRWGPKDYWRAGPVYVQKRLVFPALAALSIAVLLMFGLPFPTPAAEGESIPAFRYDDPGLAGHSGMVQVLDSQGRVRYVGEVAAGAYTGWGNVFDASGGLLYDGPLADGVYEGADAKVYRDGTLVYTGEMAANLYEGQGRRIDPASGTVSEGQFSRGFLEGQGREFDSSGVLLREGSFSRDLLEGEGVEYGPGGAVLREGTFSAGLLHGEGRAYAASGSLLYEGQFWRGVYHGQGTLYNTLLNVRSAEGTFVYGTLAGRGSIYHPSGQLLYTGQVCGERPRADAFLGLSLAEVEEAFTTHWVLYSCEETAAFVYPYFGLMFITESPIRLLSPSAPEEPEEPAIYKDEIFAPDTDKRAVLITRVLSYGQPLPCAPQPETDLVSGQHAPGWREWFSAFAMGDIPKGANVRQSGPFVWRFTPWDRAEDGGAIDEFRAVDSGLETVTAYQDQKDMPLWYQTAQWKE